MNSMHEQQHKAEYINNDNDHWIFLNHGIGYHLNGISHHEAYERSHTVGQRRVEAHFGKQANTQQGIWQKYREELNEKTDNLGDTHFDELVHQDQLLIVPNKLKDGQPTEQTCDACNSFLLDAWYEIESSDDLKDVGQSAEYHVELKDVKIVLHFDLGDCHLVRLHPLSHPLLDLVLLLLGD